MSRNERIAYFTEIGEKERGSNRHPSDIKKKKGGRRHSFSLFIVIYGKGKKPFPSCAGKGGRGLSYYPIERMETSIIPCTPNRWGSRTLSLFSCGGEKRGREGIYLLRPSVTMGGSPKERGI